MAEKGYCVKCKKKNIEIKNPEKVITKNNKNAVRGICPICGTKMYKFVSNK